MIKRLWFRSLSRARIYRRLIVRSRPMSRPYPDVTARVPVCVRVLAVGEIDAYVAFRPDQSIDDVRRRVDEGQLCFAAWHERRIIHAAWAVTGRAWIEYLSTEITLAPDEVYSYDTFTSPAFRGLNVAPARLLEMIRYFRDRGYGRQIGVVLPENKSSLRLGEKVGERVDIGVIGYVGLGPWRHVFCHIERGHHLPGGPSPRPGPAQAGARG